MTSSTPPRVALVGAGRVGTSIALVLQQAGLEIAGVSSRSESSRRSAAGRLSCPEFDYRSGLPAARVVLVGVADPALERVVGAIAPHLVPGTFVCHFSGSLGTRPLAAARAAGARTCALHPVQAFPDVDTAVARVPGSTWGVTCDAPDAPWADDFVTRLLKGRAVHVREEDRPVWHAAAVMVSNGIAALLAIGESMMTSIGVDDPSVALSPIALATVANARDGGGGGPTLTGPVVRGESFVIERHLDRLAGGDDDLVAAYMQVVRMIISAARSAGRIDPDVAEDMARLVTPS